MSAPAYQNVVEDTSPQRWLSIIGIGEDGVDGLTPAAQSLITSAKLVIGGARHLKLAETLISGQQLTWPSPLTQAFDCIEQHRGQPVVVLASGDPFYFGVGKQLAERFSAEEFLCLPQPSSLSLAAARLGWALQDVKVVTLHGRPLAGLVRHLQPSAKILALSWDKTTPTKVADLLAERGLGQSKVTVLEAMGGSNESIRTQLAGDCNFDDVADLNTIAIELSDGPIAAFHSLTPGLEDTHFENDGQLTKREVRAVTLSALAPRYGERLWDIGLGAGSVAIEWLLSDPSLKAIGFEKRQDRADRAMRNAVALGVPDLKVIVGEAPDVCTGLQPPDAVFIGGGLTHDGVFETAWRALKSGGRLVANVVTLESEQRILQLRKQFGGDLTRIEIARAEAVGPMHGWRAAMPVTQWRVTKP